jgi:maleate isomerase
MTGQINQIANPGMKPRPNREYGRAGLFAVLTPQGNPTAETEIRLALPPACAALTTRMYSANASLRQRLIDYSELLDTYIADFNGIRFDAAGFACTGSSYLATPGEERRRLDAAEKTFGFPVLTAAGAIEQAVAHLGIGALALISPYPEWLTTASREHWKRAGLRVAAVLQLSTEATTDDAHGIYGLTTEAVLEQAADFDIAGADAILVTGTGMPSLRVILALADRKGKPVLASNLCLAWALARLAGCAEAGPESPLLGGWQERLALS